MDELFRPIDILNSSARELYDGIGRIFTIADFITDVRTGCITDCDGFGELMIDDHVLSDSIINLYSETVSVNFFGNIDFTMLSMIYGNRVKICWYNN